MAFNLACGVFGATLSLICMQSNYESNRYFPLLLFLEITPSSRQLTSTSISLLFNLSNQLFKLSGIYLVSDGGRGSEFLFCSLPTKYQNQQMTQRSLICDGIWSHAAFLCRWGVVSDLIVPFFCGGHQYHTVLITEVIKHVFIPEITSIPLT